MVTPSGLLENLLYVFLSPVVDPCLLSGYTSGIAEQTVAGNPYAPPSWYYRCAAPPVDVDGVSYAVPGANADWFAE